MVIRVRPGRFLARLCTLNEIETARLPRSEEFN